MSKKNTRNALMMSALSLLLCVSMLVGTTFAWFTDSVQSGTNTITAGNLDVQLFHEDKAGSGEVTSTTPLFDDVMLWEPGAMVYEKLTVENNGSLALKYALTVSISEISEVNGKSLADVLKIAVMDDMPTRENIKTAAVQDLATFQRNGTLLANGDRDTYYVAIYWAPSANDNDYNVADEALKATLGVNLVATQMTKEEDSFNNQYDAESKYPVLGNVIKEDSESAILKAEEVQIDLPSNAPAGNYTIEISNKNETTDANGNTTVALDINLKKDGVKVVADGTTTYTVQVELGKNLEVTAVTHKGVAVENFSYDPTIGIVTFTTDSFSPFTVTFNDADAESVFVPSNPEAAENLEKDGVVAVDENGNEYTTLTAAVKSGASKIYCKEGANLGTISHLDVANDLVIYGNGAYISGGERDLSIDTYVLLNKDITVTVYNLHGIAYWGQRNTSHTVNLNLYNCNDLSRVYISGTSGTNNIALYNCTASVGNAEAYKNLIGDTVVYSNANGSVLIDGCTFKNIGCPVNLNHKIAGEQTVTVTNSTFIDCATEGTAAYYAPIRLYNSVEGANQDLTVTGNTFTYSDGKAPINNADVLLNAKHNGKDAIGSIEANVQIAASVVCGANVVLNHTIANADEFVYFASEVNKGEEYYGNTYKDKTVLLIADIDLGGAEWTPIGNFGSTSKQFCGIFDGQGHTVSNFQITQKSADRAGKNRSPHGFFGNVNGTVKNLTIANATVKVTDDGRFVGGIIGRLNGGLVENCTLVNSHVEGSAWQIGGIVGQVNAGTIEDCVVKNTTVAGKAGLGAVAGFQMEAKETSINNCAVESCTIAQNGSYGEDYDNMFAAIIGCVNNSAATVNINACTVKNTTVKGNPSDAVVGYIEAGATVTVDGVSKTVE